MSLISARGKVIATWNRCGLNDADVMTSEDEEIVTDADATAAANSQQFQLQIKDHETTIVALKVPQSSRQIDK